MRHIIRNPSQETNVQGFERCVNRFNLPPPHLSRMAILPPTDAHSQTASDSGRNSSVLVSLPFDSLSLVGLFRIVPNDTMYRCTIRKVVNDGNGGRCELPN